MSDTKKLVDERGRIKAQLTRFITYVDKISHQDFVKSELKVRVEKIDKSYEQFSEVQSKLEDLDDSQCSERNEFEEAFFEVIGRAHDLVNSKDNVSETSTLNVQSLIKLPSLSIPQFSGKLEDWFSYHDGFINLIHENPSLSDIQRFYYLRSSLSGDALNIIKSLELNSGNYPVAWNLLKGRFNNSNLIIQTHIQQLFNLPKVNKESASGLRVLLDETLKHIRALEALKQPTDAWSALLVHMTTSKLDSITYREWQSIAAYDHLPTMDELIQFLNRRCTILDNLSQKAPQHTQLIPQMSRHIPSHTKTCLLSQDIKCPVCDNGHKIFECKKFLDLQVKERCEQARKHNLCFNCLRSGHKLNQCRSVHSCSKCGKRHNTLLHLTDQHQMQKPTMSATHTATQQSPQQTLLATVVVNIISNRGIVTSCRALLDSASQVNFITQSLTKRLGLHHKIINHTICGVNSSLSKVNYKTSIVIRSRNNEYRTVAECLVLPSITQSLPSTTIDIADLTLPTGIHLADPGFHVSASIDLLLGADIFWEVLQTGCMKLDNNLLELRETHFGWIVTGKVASSPAILTSHMCTLNEINSNIQKFWAIEECKGDKKLTGNDKLCEDIYKETTTREADGRYCVQIPLKNGIDSLGKSKDNARQRLLSLEKRLTRNPGIYKQYRNFMNEYESLGHMQRLSNEEADLSEGYYIPHHAVIKEESTTTKLRVVFDASAKTSSGLSLNDISMVGPIVQSDLISIISRFRTHAYVFTADIEKMYRQVRIIPEQCKLQRILWRENTNLPISTFQLLTITYGTASAPYLATRTLSQLAIDEQHYSPTASKAILEDFYVDDLMTGTSTIEEAKQLQTDIIEMVRRGGFHLRKWSANDTNLLTHLPTDDVVQSCFSPDQDARVKTLGLIWNPKEDTFGFSVNKITNSQQITKRTILASIGQIFDPLGLLGPVIVLAKLIMQKLWCRKIDWDEIVPEDLRQQWEHYQMSLTSLSKLNIPRAIINKNCQISKLEIHGFADASESAYGACLYLKSIDVLGNISVSLITSKSRVAPLKKISLPRLELCAALLLAELARQTANCLHKNIDELWYYSDSEIVLAWISSPSSHWTTFVANRVCRIQEITNAKNWKHIKGEENPADCLSRGLLPDQLLRSTLYWKGPCSLQTDGPTGTLYCRSEEGAIPERRQNGVSHVSTISEGIFDFTRYSSFTKLLRVVAYSMRFVYNIKNKLGRKTSFLTSAELKSAEQTIIKFIQREAFNQEIECIQGNQQIPKGNKLISLAPFLDSDGLLRVGGRLQHSDLHPDQIHPVLLPKNHIVTRLIARYEHVRSLHSGPQLLLSIIRQKYWPIGGRNLVRRVFQQCTTCIRYSTKSVSQIMGELPKQRVQPSRPFQTTGVDYCGPFYVTYSKRRGAVAQKAYVSVFICFSTKALHLELVEDLTTSSFLAALRRFISRRGKPQSIYSDNGTNFVGANRELKDLITVWKSQQFEEVTSTLAHEGIEWHFIPPTAPHFGGLWESAVRLVKTHIKRVIGKSTLTLIQFSTFLTQAESFINSRPLTSLSNNPNDLSVLTPSHFLIGNQPTGLPEPDLTSTSINRLTSWQRVQQLTQHFWKRWSTEYLHQLQQRSQWKKIAPNVKIGQMVLLKDDNVPPMNWRMARIVNTHPGPDNNVRVVTVRTTHGEVKRPITRLCVLPLEV